MEILTTQSDLKPQVLGDIYLGYFVPSVLCGRSDAFRRDITSFISEWISGALVSDLGSFLEIHPDFGLYSIGDLFRERHLSKLLVVSPKESVSDVWEILWGIWADVLKSISSDRYDAVSLLYGVACIYVMFYLYHCQTGPEILPIPLAIGESTLLVAYNAADTISICLDVCTVSLSRFRICTVSDVFDLLFRRHCIRVCLHDGLQYIPQDRVGRPLGCSRKL
ncbi:hypothetical protein BBBOND_0100410 [Babesia bigemina]|uniref:Uncharacterized protein n=1 Tax=Babesia bigemina TaxID=5866 RepID=A0A061D0P5_BABBI|nr:hypothetical protein BBBOND_0100410 [Babesia bigemina]CDR93712.1 hypothetical protein BBBOND_0100410 [Babesia bigemina]|eukprot:XP_012765898.1 hypothetical protein BBBOND_0100410 [Babesia bigemina]